MPPGEAIGDDLPQGMDTTVRAPCSPQRILRPAHSPKSNLKNRLDRPAPLRLTLETLEVGAIIGDDRFVSCDRRAGLVTRPGQHHTSLFFHQFQQDHLGRIALSRAKLDDPRIAAGAIRVAGRHIVEELLHDGRIV